MRQPALCYRLGAQFGLLSGISHGGRAWDFVKLPMNSIGSFGCGKINSVLSKTGSLTKSGGETVKHRLEVGVWDYLC